MNLQLIEVNELNKYCKLSVSCTALTSEQQKENIALLKRNGFTFSNISPDTIRARITRDQVEILELIEELENYGYCWN